jgi:hypothetical protein
VFVFLLVAYSIEFFDRHVFLFVRVFFVVRLRVSWLADVSVQYLCKTFTGKSHFVLKCQFACCAMPSNFLFNVSDVSSI